MYTGKMQGKILNSIKTLPIITRGIEGERIRVKELSGFHLIVVVKMNQYEAGFMNGDVCQVLYECVDEPGYVFIQRLEDAKQGGIRKNLLRIPVEFLNFEQYMLGDEKIKKGDN